MQRFGFVSIFDSSIWNQPWLDFILESEQRSFWLCCSFAWLVHCIDESVYTEEISISFPQWHLEFLGFVIWSINLLCWFPQDGTWKILKCLISIETCPLHLADYNTMRSIFKISTVNSTTRIYPCADNCLEEKAFGKFVQLGWTNIYWF